MDRAFLLWPLTAQPFSTRCPITVARGGYERPFSPALLVDTILTVPCALFGGLFFGAGMQKLKAIFAQAQDAFVFASAYGPEIVALLIAFGLGALVF